jgi:glycosyltransferase involved in cell wall biosynthesis
MFRLAAGLVARGVDVDLVAANAVGPLRDQVPSGVELVDLHARRVAASLPRLVCYLRDRRPEAMISAKDHANVVAVAAKRLARTGARIIVTSHTPPSHSGGDRVGLGGRILVPLMRPALRRADAVVAVSGGVADDLANVAGIPRRSIAVVPNPVITDEFVHAAKEPARHPWLGDPAAPVLIAVGRLAPQKDYPTLLKAVSLLRTQRKVRLIIVGGGDEEPKLKSLASDLSISDRVCFVGEVERPAPLIAASAALVLSSRWEGLPTVLIEALAVGTPIVATDCVAGPREILDGGRLGRLVPPGDTRALADAIVTTLDHPLAPASQEELDVYRVPAAVNRYLELATGTT